MNKPWLIDTLERTVATFAEAFIGGLSAPGVIDLLPGHQPHVDLSGVQSAFLAGVIAALAVVKAALAKFSGSPDSASLVS